MTLDAELNLQFLERIFNADNVKGVLDSVFDLCRIVGADKFSYHPEILFKGISTVRSEVFATGFPAEWVDLYIRGGAQIADPIPDLVMRKARVMTWQEAIASLKLTPAQKAFFRMARAHGLTAGLGFPLWGARGQNAFVAIGFPDNEIPLPPATLRTVHTMLLAAHQKIVELSSGEVPEPVLSEREREVLTWVAKGKSNNDIATIIAISPETVATYMRRIYAKLGCNDRIGAVIKALRNGLIRL